MSQYIDRTIHAMLFKAGHAKLNSVGVTICTICNKPLHIGVMWHFATKHPEDYEEVRAMVALAKT